MHCCTFFGNRNCSEELFPEIKQRILSLIITENVDKFLVGNQGYFDYYVRKALRELKETFPHINVFVILAYMPTSKDSYSSTTEFDTIYPDGLENIPRKYAIIKRNEWMIKNCDFVIGYTRNPYGNSATFLELAKKKKKTVIII